MTVLCKTLCQNLLIYRFITFGHVLHTEVLQDMIPASLTVQLSGGCDRSYTLFNTFAQKASLTVSDYFWRRTHLHGNHWRSCCHRFNHHQAKGFEPGNWE